MGDDFLYKKQFGIGVMRICYGIPWPEHLLAKQFPRSCRRFYGLVIGPFMLGFWTRPVKVSQ